MNIKNLKVTVGEVCDGYVNDAEDGVTGYDDRLNIRPQYQREFIYKDQQRDEVIRTIMRGLPLNVMYWCKSGLDAYELMDGQQRTIAFCEYVDGTFSVDGMYFYNLPRDKKKEFLDYELMIYVCDGTDSEKLEWFKIINIAGEKLTDQELRNAVYAGPWTADAKRYFSKSGCAAKVIAGDYLSGSSIRQEYLQTAIEWIADKEKTTIEGYMAKHQQDAAAAPLWTYFRSVITWVETIFPVKRKEMKGISWGVLYNMYGNRTDLDPKALEAKIKDLLEDDDVTNSRGVYRYLLDGNEKWLNIRAFTPKQKRTAYGKQNGICPICGKHFEIEEMEADHITPWHSGGKTVQENCQCLCKACNRTKSGK